MKVPTFPQIRLPFSLWIGLFFWGGAVQAQNQGNNWYFGNNAAITFNTVPPGTVAGCAMQQREGNATISDAAGNLLFYTDGVTVWNANNTPMPNGTGLLGQIISAQSAVVAPLPQSSTQYYVFTVPDWQNTGSQAALRYSIVDMSLNGGLGDVTTQKNVLINANVREQITAVQHCNRRDVWIITHEQGGTRYVAYLLTPAGLNMTPVVSNVGLMPYTGANRYGYLKSSTDGTRLCSTLGGVAGNNIELTSFNNATGLISNPVTFSSGGSAPYSSEFSPDNTKLYSVDITSPQIRQYDITSGTAATITASQTDVSTGGGPKGCLQVGPDGKIYVTKDFNAFIGVIHTPNLAGMACNYVDNAINLSSIGGQGRIGFPNFVQSFFLQPLDLGNDTALCSGDTLTLNAATPGSTYLWQDGSTDSTFTVTASGTYRVQVFRACDTLRDTIEVLIGGPQSSVQLGNDTTICPNTTLLLDATTPGAVYEWQNGFAGATFTVSTSGLYWVKVTTACGTAADSIQVTVSSPSPALNLGNDTTLCGGGPLLLNTGIPGASYLWQDGSTDSTFTVTVTGTYWVRVILPCDTLRDTIAVTIGPTADTLYLGADTTICSTAPWVLDATTPGASYLWQNGAVTPTFHVTATGTYWVRAILPCDTLRDTVQITLEAPVMPVNLPDSLFLCPGQSVLLSTDSSAAAYVWNTGQTTPAITVSDTGTYRVTASDACGQTATDSSAVAATSYPELLPTEVETQACTDIHLVLDAFPGSGHQWSTGEITPSITVHDTGTYTVTFKICDSVFTQVFTVKANGLSIPSPVYFPNAFTPNGDQVNEKFRVIGIWQAMDNFELYIYNRWGNLLYQTADPLFEWDGTFLNKLVSNGVYYFVGSYTHPCTGKNVIKGHVTVFR